jgi:hypothetical protein
MTPVDLMGRLLVDMVSKPIRFLQVNKALQMRLKRQWQAQVQALLSNL